MNTTSVLEAYSRLKSLRQNVPARYVDARFVDEFHQILDLLGQASGADLKNFRIPPSEVRPVCTGGNYLTGKMDYSTDPYCDNSYFVMKVDGVLTMLHVVLGSGSSTKPPIGFKPPKG